MNRKSSSPAKEPSLNSDLDSLSSALNPLLTPVEFPLPPVSPSLLLELPEQLETFHLPSHSEAHIDLPSETLSRLASCEYHQTSLATMKKQFPEFRVCGSFSGGNDEPAARWLKKYEIEWKNCLGSEEIPPRQFFNGLGFLLAGEAATWAEVEEGISELFESPSAENVLTFKSLFTQQFPIRIPDRSSVTLHNEITNLKQSPSESLANYKRA